jgi:hypothetical protein
MIGQYHPPINMEWTLAARGPHRVAKGIDVLDQKIGAPFQEIYREKVRASRHSKTAIIGHRV